MTGIEKLQNDLKIIERFNEDIPAYIRRDTLFYPTGPNFPDLTFGGFLMRQHRLLLLRDLLNTEEQNRLDKAIAEFQAALDGSIVAFEKRCHKELITRHRLWREHVRDLVDDKAAFAFYSGAVEPRLMIAAIVQQLSLPPFQLDSDIPERVESLDMTLRARWIPGDFVLQPELEPAYPQNEFWYLYGAPA